VTFYIHTSFDGVELTTKRDHSIGAIVKLSGGCANCGIFVPVPGGQLVLSWN